MHTIPPTREITSTMTRAKRIRKECGGLMAFVTKKSR